MPRGSILESDFSAKSSMGSDMPKKFPLKGRRGEMFPSMSFINWTSYRGGCSECVRAGLAGELFPGVSNTEISLAWMSSERAFPLEVNFASSLNSTS